MYSVTEDKILCIVSFGHVSGVLPLKEDIPRYAL